MLLLSISFSEMPQVSIVIPAYNVEHCLETAIKSALNQTYVNKDIVIVNDGSTDKTQNIIKKYENYSNVKAYQLPHNRGILYARAIGISHASDFFIFLDADDQLFPDIIEKAVKRQQETGADVIFFNTWHTTEENPKLTLYEIASAQSAFDGVYAGEALSLRWETQRKIFPPVWGRMYRTSNMQEAVRRFNILLANRIILNEDVLIQAALLLTNPTLAGLNADGYQYYDNPKSVTHQMQSHEGEWWYRFYQRMLEDSLSRKYCKMYFLKLQQQQKARSAMFAQGWRAYDFPFAHGCRQFVHNSRRWREGMYASNFDWSFVRFISDRGDIVQQCYKELTGDWAKYELSQHAQRFVEGGFVELWNGENSEEIFESGLSLEETIELVDQIWAQKESGRLNVEAENMKKAMIKQEEKKINESGQTVYILPYVNGDEKITEDMDKKAIQLNQSQIQQMAEKIIQANSKYSTDLILIPSTFGVGVNTMCNKLIKTVNETVKSINIKCVSRQNYMKYLNALSGAKRVIVQRGKLGYMDTFWLYLNDVRYEVEEK